MPASLISSCFDFCPRLDNLNSAQGSVPGTGKTLEQDASSFSNKDGPKRLSIEICAGFIMNDGMEF